MDPSKLASIVGHVFDAAGRPVADATVMIETSDRPHHDIALLTDARGEFRFVDLLPGNYTIAARTPDGARSRATMQLAAGQVARVRLASGA